MDIKTAIKKIKRKRKTKNNSERGAKRLHIKLIVSAQSTARIIPGRERDREKGGKEGGVPTIIDYYWGSPEKFEYFAEFLGGSSAIFSTLSLVC